MRPPRLITDALPRAADVICVWVRPPHRAGMDHGAADVQSLPSACRATRSLTAGRSIRCWRVVSRPRTALGLRRWETPVDDHDGDPLRPRLLARLGDTVSQRAPEVCSPSIETQDPCCPRLTDIFPPPIRMWGSTATPFPRRAACRASACHCCCPAVSASRAKTSAPISRTQSQRQPCTPKIATTRATPAARSASASKAPSHTHSGPAPACNAAALKYPFSPGRWSWRFALGTSSAVFTVRPYRFTR